MQQNKKSSTLPREGAEMLPQDVPANSSGTGRTIITQAWDPYDVWLKRVKLPRERQPQRVAAPVEAQVMAANEARSGAPAAEDPLLIPGVS